MGPFLFLHARAIHILHVACHLYVVSERKCDLEKKTVFSKLKQEKEISIEEIEIKLNNKSEKLSHKKPNNIMFHIMPSSLLFIHSVILLSVLLALTRHKKFTSELSHPALALAYTLRSLELIIIKSSPVKFVSWGNSSRRSNHHTAECEIAF